MPSETTTSVPSADMLNGDFSFGGLGYPLYDPKSIRQVNSVWTSDPIANNLVPNAQWDPVAVKFLALNPWVKANQPGTLTQTGPSQNLIDTGEKPIKRIRFDVKIDHQFTYAHKMFGRYSHAFHRAARGGFNPQLAWTDLDSNRQPQPIDLNNGVISDTYLLSPTRFNDIRVGYNRRRSTGDSLTYGQDWAKQLGIPGVGAETFPNLNVGYGFSDLPFGKGRRWLSQAGVLDYAFGGWGLSVNDTLDSGMPSGVGFSGSPNKYLTGTRIVPLTKIEDALTPNWNIGPNRFPTTAPPQTPYLKASSFAYPASYTTGFLGKNVFESPGMQAMGFAVKKTWTFKERFKATFRLDAHNLPFKQPNFSRPASTWNAASPQLFGYVSSARGAWSEYGYNQATIQLGGRFEF